MNLNLAGQRIIGSRIDFAVTLRTDGGYGFRIETDFVVHAISGDHRVSVEKTGQLTLDFTCADCVTRRVCV
ncbi:MAG TPA: hypothetical protein VGH89_06340 [Pseudonocardia sp.]